jgi:hypothetical protein
MATIDGVRTTAASDKVVAVLSNDAIRNWGAKE